MVQIRNLSCQFLAFYDCFTIDFQNVENQVMHLRVVVTTGSSVGLVFASKRTLSSLGGSIGGLIGGGGGSIVAIVPVVDVMIDAIVVSTRVNSVISSVKLARVGLMEGGKIDSVVKANVSMIGSVVSWIKGASVVRKSGMP